MFKSIRLKSVKIDYSFETVPYTSPLQCIPAELTKILRPVTAEAF